MKTLLLRHREISSFLITLLFFGVLGLVCGNFYKNTHHFAQKGNAPLNLKILSMPIPKIHKEAPKPKPKPPKPQSKMLQKPKPQALQKPESKTVKPPQEDGRMIEKPQESSKEILPEQEMAKVQENLHSQETSDDQEVVESVELVASIQGEHFELYNQVHRAILKNVFYPKKARYKKLSGTVIVEFVLEKNGSITQERVVQSSGYALLDTSALKTLNQTQFPTTQKRYRFRVPLRYG